MEMIFPVDLSGKKRVLFLILSNKFQIKSTALFVTTHWGNQFLAKRMTIEMSYLTTCPNDCENGKV